MTRLRPRLHTTLSAEELATLGANPGRTIGALARALAAGDVCNLETHYAATDAARDRDATRAATNAANMRHGNSGKPYAVDAWPNPDESPNPAK